MINFNSLKRKQYVQIKQSIVKEILKNPENFNKYVANNKKKITGDSRTEGQIYAKAVVDYVRYLKNHGMKLNTEQELIVDKCTEINSEKISWCIVGDPEDMWEDSSMETEITNETDADVSPETIEITERNCRLRRLIINIVSDDSKLRSFMRGDINLDRTTYDELLEYINDYDSFFGYYTKPGLICGDGRVVKNIRKLYCFLTQRPDICNHSDENHEVDPELEQKIFSMVSQDLLNKKEKSNEEQVELAHQIYDSLNSCVVYDEKIHLADQGELAHSIGDKELVRAFHKKFNKVTAKDNRVICKNWSILYAKLLNKANIRAYVTYEKMHTKVVFLDSEDNIYIADSTESQDRYNDEENIFRISDIMRSKLGLQSMNFYRLSLNDENITIREYYRDGKFVKKGLSLSRAEYQLKGAKARMKIAFSKSEKAMFKDFLQRALKNEPIGQNEHIIVKKILKAMEDAGKVPDIFINIFNNKNIGRTKMVSAKIKLINRMLLAMQPVIADDNLLNRALSSNLAFMLMEKDSIEKFDRFYIVDERGNVKLQPIIYTDNIEDKQDRVPERMDIIYIWDEKKGFVRTTPEQIKKRLQKGELYYNYHAEYNDDILRSPLENEILADSVKYCAFDGDR